MLAQKSVGLKAKIRPADLGKDKELLINMLFEHLTPSSDHARFEWLYQRNPQGPARAWIATDAATGEMIGTSAAFSRRAVVNGVEKTGWVLGDFCISDKYRSLGPALQLQRATLQALKDGGKSDFCYDFPSREFSAVYQRLGMAPAAQAIRFTKLLRLDQKLQQLNWTKGLAKPASWLGNFVLQASDRWIGSSKGWAVAIHEGRCGDEFTLLCQNPPATNALEIQRSAEFLNWRYLDHPSACHQILTARKGGELQGYLVFSRNNGNAEIEEWWPRHNRALLAALIADLVGRLRECGTTVLTTFLLNTDPHQQFLKGMGFLRRESSPFIACWPGGERGSAPEWHLMHGDRDI
ncbi:MAG TPA: hypothetical protein VF532_14545 [Candidatus Angelobacter sp.]